MDSPGIVLFESFLFKTPPLDKLIVNWKKRWFVLRKKDPFDAASVELVYYGDPLKKELKGVIPADKLAKVYHTPSKNKQEHVFAVETSDKKDKKFLLKATEHNTKNIWLAKLTELTSSGDLFHVTVPHQPGAQFIEGIAKTSLPTKIDVTCPSLGVSVMEVEFQHLRRFGYEIAYDVDMVWFESCNCKSKEQDGMFHFFLVASGIEAAQYIVMEVKRKIETCTRTHLIQEQSDDVHLSFISRAHYGCTPYPPSSRMKIIQSSLMSLQSSWGRTSGLGGGERKGSTVHLGSASWTFGAGALAMNQTRRNTVQPLLNARSPSPLPPSPRHSPSPSPVPSPSHSPNSSTPSKTTLNQFRRESHASTSSKSDTSDSGVPLDEFDSSRSAPPLYASRKTTLGDFRKGNRSFDSGGDRKHSSPGPSRVTLNDTKGARREGHDSGILFPSKDSILGGSGELILEDSGKRSAYDHLESHQGYDHLSLPGQQPNVPPRSLASLRHDYIKM